MRQTLKIKAESKQTSRNIWTEDRVYQYPAEWANVNLFIINISSILVHEIKQGLKNLKVHNISQNCKFTTIDKNDILRYFGFTSDLSISYLQKKLISFKKNKI